MSVQDCREKLANIISKYYSEQWDDLFAWAKMIHGETEISAPNSGAFTIFKKLVGNDGQIAITPCYSDEGPNDVLQIVVSVQWVNQNVDRVFCFKVERSMAGTNPITTHFFAMHWTPEFNDWFMNTEFTPE